MTSVSTQSSVRAARPASRPASLLMEQSLPWRAERKSPAMIVSVLLAYAVCTLIFTPRLFVLFSESSLWLAYIAIALFIVLIQIFWLYGCFYVVQALFCAVSWYKPWPAPPPVQGQPRVAILYTTLHDFQERAVLSCMRQSYPHCHTFILDDSRQESYKTQIDEFALRHPGQVTVIRRGDRLGHKAGNINNALENHIRDYEFFALADADSVFPPDFIAELLPHFGGDKSVGFVQAAFRPDPYPKTKFARDLCLQIHCMWSVYCRARNRFGAVIFLGHGGILRYDVWQAIGGFPTIISEDLAFSHRAARQGYRGRYVLDVFSYEEFPDSYLPFRKQQNRYVQGICQYLHRESMAYFRSPHIRWFEKLDTLLTCGGLLMPFLFLTFLLLYCVTMPILFGVQNIFVLEVANYQFRMPVMLLSQRFYDLSFDADYFLFTMLCTLAPCIGVVPLMLRHPIGALRMVVLAAGPYMSLLVASTLAVLSYVFFRTAVFTSTGDRSAATGVACASASPGETALATRRSKWASRVTKEAWVALSEAAFGVVLVWMCLLTLNLSLLGFAVAIALAPILMRARWDALWLRPWLYLPYLLLLVGLLLGSANLLPGMGVPMSAFMFTP